MTILTILKYPNRILRRPLRTPTCVDDESRQLAQSMVETMLAAQGVGLAAPQVGASQRLFVADVSENRDHPLILFNPRILWKDGEQTHEEGCLSLPGITAPVTRAQALGVTGLGLSGEEVNVQAEGLLAVCIQHEIDHLEGVLFIDYLSNFKRRRLLQKYHKLQLAAEQA